MENMFFSEAHSHTYTLDPLKSLSLSVVISAGIST